MRGTTKKRRWPRLSKRQQAEAIERYANANKSDPFAAVRAESRLRYGLFEMTEGVVHVFG